MIVDVRKTRAYRIVLVLANALVAVGALIGQGGDLTQPLAYIPILIGAFNIAVIAIRQIKDPSTPTLPSGGPIVQPPANTTNIG